MKNRYCYWSVCSSRYVGLMQTCVQSARRAGVFNEFHVFSDQLIDECECYDALNLRDTKDRFKLIYLKLGMAKLLFDYFIWVDADSWFVRKPRNILDCLGNSPIHVPLTTRLSQAGNEKFHNGLPICRYRELMEKAGVWNPVYASSSAFWIVHREAIDRVCELADYFDQTARSAGVPLGASAALGYAAQMLCADPDKHSLRKWPYLWASDDAGLFASRDPEGAPWLWCDPVTGRDHEVNPAIIHLPTRKAVLAIGRPGAEKEHIYRHSSSWELNDVELHANAS